MANRADQSGSSNQSVQIRSVDLFVPVPLQATGLRTAMSRPPRIDTTSVRLRDDLPGVISLALASQRPAVRSFRFATSEVIKRPDQPKRVPPNLPGPRATPPRQSTRIAPPQDLIKLDDRLYYVLQPSLEALLGAESLSLPFRPFPYQMSGIAFLYPRYAAVLADEMGLGKTMQAITAVRLLLYANQVRRVLLLCPKPLVTNWQREFSQWAPEIPLTVVQGNQATRHWQWWLADSVVTVANYELVARDAEIVADGNLEYDLVLLDEAQRIKNRHGTTASVVRRIARRRSWALTGTPIENSTDDLVGIFEFVSPGVLSPGMRPRQMSAAIRDFVLRRRKDDVLEDLPPKLIRDAELTLTPAQYETYQRAEEEGVVVLSQLGEGITVQHVFQLILRLKQICNFDPVTGESSKMDRLAADMEEIAASGRKAIIFSQYVQTLTRISEQLAPYRPVQYHGKIPSKQRDGVIEKFRSDPSCHAILMSYGAGSVGLNLQFASYVFLFDRWWNPAVEDQAINRAHRIGAAGPVTVTRFLSVATIEERIDQILQQKRELFDTMFTGDQTPSNLGLSQREIFGLFNLRGPDGSVVEGAA
ncbi:MAG TPA: DEAD/DEAH box helicase [Pirellulales bacterium]|nr:DEAD/DEAH box helicase [Pirellulales bacterium]